MSHRKTALIALVLAAGALLPGCRSTNASAGQGALIGGLLGAGGGYAVGHHRGNRTNYTLAGGLVGAMAGYIVGDAIGDNERDNRAGPETIGGSDRYSPRGRYVQDDRYGDDVTYREERVVTRRRVYYDDPDYCDPRW